VSRDGSALAALGRFAFILFHDEKQRHKPTTRRAMTPEEIAVILTRLEERIVRIERLLQEIAQGMGIET
jgi:hypothetical protein